MRAFLLFGGSLGEGADGSRGEFHLHAIDMLGLDIDFERATGGDVRVTSLVSHSSSSPGQFAGSAHMIDILAEISQERLLNYKEHRIMESPS